MTTTGSERATLERQLQGATGNERVDLLNSLSLLLYEKDPVAAEAYGAEALALATVSAYVVGQATSCMRLGVVAGSQNRLSAALVHFEAALTIFEALADEYNLAMVWNQIAATYNRLGDYLKALPFFQKAAAVFERLGEQLHLARLMNNMAILYKALGDYEMALVLYERTLKLRQAGVDQARVPHTLNNIGNLYREMGNLQQALAYLEQAEALLRTSDDKRNWAIVLINIAWCYTTLGAVDQAEPLLLQAIAIHEAFNNQESMIRGLLLLGEIALTRRHDGQALDYATRALGMAEQDGAKLEVRDAHQLLASAHAAAANYQAAYAHHQQFHIIDRELFNYQKGLQIAQMRSQYATEMAQKEAKIYRLQTEELRQAKDAAEEANRAKSRFLTSISHELRTPLTVIIGYAELIQSQYPDLHGVASIEQSGRHLLALIGDILDIARIESGQVALAPQMMNLLTFLGDLRSMMVIRAMGKGLTFHSRFADDLPRYVLADQRRLQQVLINLIDNAVKFTNEGWVALSVARVAEAATNTQKSETATELCRLRFAVQDTGIGIAPDLHATIFEPFQKGHNPERNSDGLGLGLAISRQLVALMGGELQVTSVAGHGSTFCFDVTLPLAKVVAESPRRVEQIVGYQGHPITILVVDDHAETRRLLCARLQPLGFVIIEAANGEEGLAQALAYHPDLILCDLLMPQSDGLTLIRWVREAPDLSESFAIALSTGAFDEGIDHALAAGFDHFVSKPIDFTILLTLMRDLLGLTWVLDIG